MNSLSEFWKAMFGQDISKFEEMLMLRGAWVMTPEEPLYAVFATMVRVLHESQGEAERALLQFAPELTSRAQGMISAAEQLERHVANLQGRVHEFSGALRILEARTVTVSISGSAAREDLKKWFHQNLAPLAAIAVVLAFCIGFVLASWARAG